MPKVGKKKFPYTKMGMAEAYMEAEKTGKKMTKANMKHEGMETPAKKTAEKKMLKKGMKS